MRINCKRGNVIFIFIFDFQILQKRILNIVGQGSCIGMSCHNNGTCDGRSPVPQCICRSGFSSDDCSRRKSFHPSMQIKEFGGVFVFDFGILFLFFFFLWGGGFKALYSFN